MSANKSLRWLNEYKIYSLLKYEDDCSRSFRAIARNLPEYLCPFNHGAELRRYFVAGLLCMTGSMSERSEESP